ncbi:MAG: DUF202 domain-containing protein [Nitrospirae bacterium]|nr:DUF202 domain-containing protein [Nitrospirota bacterium]
MQRKEHPEGHPGCGDERPVLKDHPVLRDHLAAQRTVLANERTLLSYVRTALTLLVAGVSFIKFFGSVVIEALGWVLVPLGLLTLAKGIASYRSMARTIREEEK